MFIEKWQNSIKAKRDRYLQSRPRPKKVENYEDDPKFNEYLKKLAALRKDGTNKIASLKIEITDIKLNKQIDKETKIKLINNLKKQIEVAKKVEARNADAVDKLMQEAFALADERYKKEYKSIIVSNQNKILKAKQDCNKELDKARDNHAKNLKRIKLSSFKDKKDKALEIQNEKNQYDSIKSGLITKKNNEIGQIRQESYAAFLARYNYKYAVRNNVHSRSERWQGRWQHFKANFDPLQWFTKYALYMIIILIFIILTIVSATTQGVNLLSGGSIVKSLQQIAPKIFFSLGAACLILLGGTDLSIGRLTGIGVSFTLMALSSTSYADNFGNVWFNTANTPAGARVLLALVLSIGFCTAFSAFSGFFTAKFKIHPFITTLATQLISYGIFQIFWSATSSFSPVEADNALMNGLRGTQGWQLILYAVIAIVIVWFIWNKTKFGKNLYAVGGNQEAAKVSGINPFVITLLAFVMAGILYGCGGFVQAIQVGTGNFTTGYGTETDAIAACVIGGISFTGGIGKVSGAVIGTVILGFLTFAFSSMGLDTNLQLVIKGLIIIAAVTLDCVKYIKKK